MAKSDSHTTAKSKVSSPKINSDTLSKTNTPYDDVFRTLLNDCTQLVLPVLNEVFGTHYTGEEKVSFSPNEHFINRQDGKEEKRITDSNFTVSVGNFMEKYLFECQSTADNSMLIRIFEYSSQVALDQGFLDENMLYLDIPQCVVLFLRSTKTTPDQMTIQIRSSGSSLDIPIMVLRIKDYSIDEIFTKNLLFLIPFYIFTYESHFSEYNSNEKKLEKLKSVYSHIAEQLDILERQNHISVYIKKTLIEMNQKILENIARRYENIQGGVKSIMGGQVLEYEAKTILQRGIREGYSQGLIRLYNSVNHVSKRLHVSIEEACDITGISMEEYNEAKKLLDQ